MSPSGLGQGGKRVRDDQAALAPGQAEAKQSRQAGVLQHLTNHEIWSHIQEWANSEDKSNPMALQRIANVTDFVDQLLDPEEVTKARKVQLQKLWERGAFTPVHRQEIPKGSQIFSHKWVDKSSHTSGLTSVPKEHTSHASHALLATRQARRRDWTCSFQLQPQKRTIFWKSML